MKGSDEAEFAAVLLDLPSVSDLGGLRGPPGRDLSGSGGGDGAERGGGGRRASSEGEGGGEWEGEGPYTGSPLLSVDGCGDEAAGAGGDDDAEGRIGQAPGEAAGEGRGAVASASAAAVAAARRRSVIDAALARWETRERPAAGCAQHGQNLIG